MIRVSCVLGSRRTKRDTTSSDSGGGSGTGPLPESPYVSSASGGSGTSSITWTRPVTKLDGSTLTSGEISSYIYRRYNTSGTELVETNVGNVLTYTETSVSAGTYEVTVACVSTYGEGVETFKYSVTVT